MSSYYDKFSPAYTHGVMHELGDDFHQFYISHPRMEMTPSLQHIPRHLHIPAMNALKMHWEGDRREEVINNPEDIGATHVGIHPKIGRKRYLHPHQVAEHKLQGWHITELPAPVPKSTITEGLDSPEQISVTYAGPTWLARKHDMGWDYEHDSLYSAIGRPKTIDEPQIVRPTAEDMKILNKEPYHGEPFAINTSSPRGSWLFGADHRTGDVSVWAN